MSIPRESAIYIGLGDSLHLKMNVIPSQSKIRIVGILLLEMLMQLGIELFLF